jgi:hypothetical protein
MVPFSSRENTMKLCRHCGGPIIESNPMGYCEHTYYPEYCLHCKAKGYTEKDSLELKRREAG